MYLLRLQKEWETVTRHQYEIDLNFDGSIRTLNMQVDAEQCIKLLTRCAKMYEAKSMISGLLKLILAKRRAMKHLKKYPPATEAERKAQVAQIRKMTQRV